MKLESKHIDLLYMATCEKLLEDPDYVSSPRGLEIQEILNAKLILDDPTSRIITLPSRNFSKKYFAGEFSFYMSGSERLSFISHYASFWKQVSDDGVSVNSCYGKRLFHDVNAYKQTQMGYVIKTLMEDENSRKAIMLIYNANDSHKSKDNPCTIMLQFFIRNNNLMATVYMRSNDIWLGTPYDIAFFTVVQEMIWVRLKELKYPKLKLGSYTHLVGSLHLYNQNAPLVRDMLNDSVLIENSYMPSITIKTFNQLDDFLYYEESLRIKRLLDKENYTPISDPFLITLMEWLNL